MLFFSVWMWEDMTISLACYNTRIWYSTNFLWIKGKKGKKKKAWYWFICLWTIQFIFYSLKNTQHYSIFSRLFPKTHHQLSLVLGTEKKKNWKLEDLFQEFFQNPLSTRFKFFFLMTEFLLNCFVHCNELISLFRNYNATIQLESCIALLIPYIT